jgi:hypothetical protein
MSEGTFGKKDDSECASLRLGKLPRADAVKSIGASANDGKSVECAEKQNNGNVVPSGKAHPTFVSSGN